MNSRQLFIFLHDTIPKSLTWVAYNDNKVTDVHKNINDKFTAYLKNSLVIAVIPAKEFSFFQVDILAGNENNFFKAVPYALEENVAEHVDDLFFSVAKKTSDPNRDTWVINDKKFQSYLGYLSELGIEANIVVPESFLLRKSNYNCTIWLRDDQMILNYNSSIVVSASENLFFLLDSLLDSEQNEIIELSCHFISITEDDNKSDVLSKYKNKEKFNFTTIVVSSSEFFTLWVNDYQRKNSHINMLQGKYSQNIDFIEIIKRWKTVFMLLFLIVVFQLGLIIFDNWKLSKNIDSLDKEIKKHYQRAFPEIKSMSALNSKIAEAQYDIDSKGNDVEYKEVSLSLYKIGTIALGYHEVTLEKVELEKSILIFTLSAKSPGILTQVFKKIQKENPQVETEIINYKGGVAMGEVKVGQ